MISLYGAQEMRLLLQPHADVPSARHAFSCSVMGRRDICGAAPHTAHCQVPQMFLSSRWPRLGHPLLQCRLWNVTLQERISLTLWVSAAKYQLSSNESKSPDKLYATFWGLSPFPFSFRTPVSGHQKVLMPARRRQAEVCVDTLFLLGFRPLQLVGMC